MRVLLGISGGIAAYKTPELIRQLKKASLEVTPILTQNAMTFVTPLSVQTVAESQAYTPHSSEVPGGILHLDLARNADVCVIAPASANTIAKLAGGFADDLLTSTVLAFQGPKCIAPAMHPEMWHNPITQKNIQILKDSGCIILGPSSGELACKDHGQGRLVDLTLIVIAAQMAAYPKLNLGGKKVLISSGGTQEPIDPVRVITNRSTGQLGNMLAHVAALNGAEVTLVTTVPPCETCHLSQVVQVETADQMQQALLTHFPENDALIMAAAVSDFTVDTASQKISRSQAVQLELKGTPDILKMLSAQKRHQKLVGFCLASTDLISTATRKLHEKSVDWIVANSPEAIGATQRQMTVISKENEKIEITGDLLSCAVTLLEKTLQFG